MNFRPVEPLLYFSQNIVVNWVQIWIVWSHSFGKIEAGVSDSRRLVVTQYFVAEYLINGKNTP